MDKKYLPNSSIYAMIASVDVGGILLTGRCRCVGTGRRDRLKICCQQWRVGSSPTIGRFTGLTQIAGRSFFISQEHLLAMKQGMRYDDKDIKVVGRRQNPPFPVRKAPVVGKGGRGVDCREACRAMADFLDGEYPVSRQEEFIWHVEHCASCKEELAVSLTLQMALNALDENTDFTYMDSDEGVQKVLDNASLKVAHYNRIRRFCWAVKTVAVWAVVLTFWLQIIYWKETGFWFFS